VNARSDTETRILDGALLALARLGTRKLSMSEICDAAAVSRGTVYRYFGNKEEVLEALGGHVTSRLTDLLTAAIVAHPAPAERVPVVVDVLLGFWQQHPAIVELGRVEPAFVIDYVERTLPEFRRVLGVALEPTLSQVPAVRSGTASVEQMVDMLLRIIFSHYFMPFAAESMVGELLARLAYPARDNGRH
jgi:AcrR family transcriptional regulator